MTEPPKQDKKFPFNELKELVFAICSPPLYAAVKIYGWYKGKKPAPPAEPPKPD